MSGAASGAPVVVCEGVSYTYADGTHANESIDLALRAGELFCLLGPNGAGKTTLLRQITTELRPSAGRVLVFGRNAHDDPIGTKKRLGVIPQTAGLFDALTVDDHLRLFGPLKHLSGRETRRAMESVAAECELDEIRARRVRNLSGGQRRKVLVALALLADPDVLLLDEPTVGLDPVARRTLWATIEKQRDAGKTILLTTHYMDEAEQLADRIGFIESGRLSRVGSLPELHAQLGKSVRVTELDPETGEARDHHYFDTLTQAQEQIRAQGFESYSVGRVSLEDIYLRIVGRALESEEPTG